MTLAFPSIWRFPLKGGQELLVSGQGIRIGGAQGISVSSALAGPDAAVADAVDRALATQEAVAAMGGRLAGARGSMREPARRDTGGSLEGRTAIPCSGDWIAIPSTLITTDPLRARAFIAAGPTVLKAVGEAYVRVGERELHGATMRVGKDWDLAEVETTPVLLQREIAKAADLPITLVGDRLFPVRIKPPPEDPVDIRATDPGRMHVGHRARIPRFGGCWCSTPTSGV